MYTFGFDRIGHHVSHNEFFFRAPNSSRIKIREGEAAVFYTLLKRG